MRCGVCGTSFHLSFQVALTAFQSMVTYCSSSKARGKGGSTRAYLGTALAAASTRLFTVTRCTRHLTKKLTPSTTRVIYARRVYCGYDARVDKKRKMPGWGARGPSAAALFESELTANHLLDRPQSEVLLTNFKLAVNSAMKTNDSSGRAQRL